MDRMMVRRERFNEVKKRANLDEAGTRALFERTFGADFIITDGGYPQDAPFDLVGAPGPLFEGDGRRGCQACGRTVHGNFRDVPASATIVCGPCAAARTGNKRA